MADKISDIKGMDPDAQSKLESTGIKTTDDLLAHTANQSERTNLAKQIGVSSNQLTEWINRADLMRLKGVGKEMANLLEEAGVDSCKELQHRKAENLQTRLQSINQEKHITHHAPTLAQVTDWIAEAAKFAAAP
jgi:predicted flap endonuclease-1-like 5' DNA nuclease